MNNNLLHKYIFDEDDFINCIFDNYSNINDSLIEMFNIANIKFNEKYFKLLDKLIEKGADINLINLDKYILKDLLTNDPYILDNLVEDISDRYFFKKYPEKHKLNELLLYGSCVYGTINIFKKIINNYSANDIIGLSPLYIATKYNHMEIIEYLINNGVNINYVNRYGKYTALHLACVLGRIAIVEYLIENGADTDLLSLFDYTPIELAAKYGHIEIIKYFTKKIDKINCNLINKSLYAAFNQEYEDDINIDVINYLIKIGANINYCDTYDNNTILHDMCNLGFFKTVKFLIKNNVVMDNVNSKYETPLYISAWCNRLNIMKLLIKNGAKINIKNINNKTLLHVACEEGHYNIVKFLIKKKLNLNYHDNNYDTPLSLAYKNYHFKIVKLLINNGAHLTNYEKHLYFKQLEKIEKDFFITNQPNNDLETFNIVINHMLDNDLFNKNDLKYILKCLNKFILPTREEQY